MVAHTSLDQTSWTLVSGNDKLNARIQILETVCGALRKALGLPSSQESDSG
jgi:polyphosphate kinase 2 (PPK2 family)